MNSIGFPNLNIGPFEINPTAISIGSFRIQWYGIIIVVGMVLACAYAYFRLKGQGFVLDDVLNIAIICIPSGIVGARLYYVIAEFESYNSIAEVFAIWEGGLAIYGGIIGGFLGVVGVCMYKKYKLMCLLDSIAPGVMLGQVIGRWGNFMNAEAYGNPALPYEFLGFTADMSKGAGEHLFIMSINDMLVYPTFLYESVWNIIGFIVINLLWKKRKFDGQIAVMYLTWYGLGRSIIEGFREDTLRMGNIRVSQLLATLCFVVGVCVLIAVPLIIKKKKER